MIDWDEVGILEEWRVGNRWWWVRGWVRVITCRAWRKNLRNFLHIHSYPTCHFFLGIRHSSLHVCWKHFKLFLNCPQNTNGFWFTKLKFFYNYENNQQDVLYGLIYYSKSVLHVAGDVFARHQEHLTVFTVSGSVHPSCCRLVSHSGNQPGATWVNTTRYCKYSQVLLMMGENIARNM